MSILDILEAHYVSTTREHRVVCKTCGILADEIMLGGEQSYRLGITHQAQVLEQHVLEAKAVALEEAAAELNRLDSDVEMYDENLHATPVETWLRDRAAQIRSGS